MRDSVAAYLDVRRELGYKDTDLAGYLSQFAEFAVRKSATHIRTELALEWVKSYKSEHYRRTILAALRRLSFYLKAEDQRHEIIPEAYAGKFGVPAKLLPFVYSRAETIAVIKALGAMQRPHPYDAQTMGHAIGLVAATGMRISEVLNLDLTDVGETTILVRKGKFGKDRLVPISQSTSAALARYHAARPRGLDCSRFFVTRKNRSPSYPHISTLFRECIDQLGLKSRNGSCQPRIHDFRHTFAINLLASCPHDQISVSNQIVALSTYLGHVSIESTFWYLRMAADTKRRMSEAMEADYNA